MTAQNETLYDVTDARTQLFVMRAPLRTLGALYPIQPMGLDRIAQKVGVEGETIDFHLPRQGIALRIAPAI